MDGSFKFYQIQHTYGNRPWVTSNAGEILKQSEDRAKLKYRSLINHPTMQAYYDASNKGWQVHHNHGVLEEDRDVAVKALLFMFDNVNDERLRLRVAKVEITQTTTEIVTAGPDRAAV